MAERGGKSLDHGTPPRIEFDVEKIADRQIKKADAFFVDIDNDDPFPGNDLSLFTSLYEKLSTVEISTMRTFETRTVQAVETMGGRIANLKKLLADPKAAPDDVLYAKRELLRDTIRAVYWATKAIGGFSPEHASPRQSFEMIVGNCFVMNAKAVAGQQKKTDLVAFAYGDFFVDAYHVKAEKLAAQAADAANARLPEVERVSISRARELVAAARDFQLPNGMFSVVPLRTGDLPEILRVNFAALRKRLGLAEGQHLTAAEINYLAVFFANRAKVVDTAYSPSFNVIRAMISMDDPLRDDPTQHYTSINLVGGHPLAEAIRALDANGANQLKDGLGEDIGAFIDALRINVA